MATTAMNVSIPEGNGSIQKTSSANTQQAKASLAAKSAESPRRTEDDQRRIPPAKAWASGINPITQRQNTPTQPNGTSVPPKSKPSTVTNSGSLTKANGDQQLDWVLGYSYGSSCSINTKSGQSFSGIFAGCETKDSELKLLFKMVKPLTQDASSSKESTLSSEYVGLGEGHEMVFPITSVSSVAMTPAFSVNRGPSNGSTQTFRTDTDISGNVAFKERNLQRWESPTGPNAIDMSLGSKSNWDQFATNEERFGLKTDYDETIYTTKIDKSTPGFEQRERKAERIAREIEATSSPLPKQDNDGLDEEDKYSGVRRTAPEYPPLQSNQPNKYMPPARRGNASTSAATMATVAAAAARPATNVDVSVDPAMIASQIKSTEPNKVVAEPGKPTEKTSEKQVEIPAAGRSEKATAKSGKINTKDVPEIPSATSTASAAKPTDKGSHNATENVEVEVRDAFRVFANNEKLKVQDQRRSRASADRDLKIKELKSFSQTFKLLTAIPKDLVPILAKSEIKQKEIVERAQRLAEEGATSTPTETAGDSKPKLPVPRRDPKSTLPSVDTPARSRAAAAATTTTTTSQDQSQSALQGPKESIHRVHQLSQTQNPRHIQNGLSQRLENSHRIHKAANMSANTSGPPPAQDNLRGAQMRNPSYSSALPSPKKVGPIRMPLPSAKFNANATEFKPNPTANAFKPATMASVVVAPAIPVLPIRAINPSQHKMFYSDQTAPRKAIEEVKNFPGPAAIAVFKILKPTDHSSKAATGSKPGFATPPSALSNGGYPMPYRTHPTWSQLAEGEEPTTYRDCFKQVPTASPKPPVIPVEARGAHQHQLPFHLQNGMAGAHQNHPHQPPPHQHSQTHHFPNTNNHYDDHHMRPSASSSGYPVPSPRPMPHATPYQASPMPHPSQIVYGPPIPYVMHQNGHMSSRQFSNGPPMLTSQAGHLAPTMVPQGSNQGYIPPPMAAIPFNPQMQMYPGGAIPPIYGSPSQPPSQYPSPGRAAPMMMHQGSHQSQHQPLYMPAGQFGQPAYAQQPPTHVPNMRGGYGSPQPHYSQNHYQNHHYPHQPHRTPSSGYAQPHQAHQPHHQHMPSQQAPPNQGPPEMGDEAK